jgi:hypothetical protein
MKTPRFFILLFCFIGTFKLLAQQAYHQVYGTVQTDINRGYKIVALPNNTFVIGGQWNDKAYLMKVSASGNQLIFKSLDTRINGISLVKDILVDADGSLVVVGECTRCVTTDTLKKVFAVRTDANLEPSNLRIYGGSNVENNVLFAPSIARKGNNLMLIAATGGLGLNFEDIVLQSLNANLDTIWRKTINSCAACGFEYPFGLAATANGFTTIVGHAFTDTLTMYHFNASGNVLWKTRNFTFGGLDDATIAANGNGKIYIAGGAKGLPSYDPTKFTAVVTTISEADGATITGTVINVDTLTDETVRCLNVAADGSILVGHRRSAPNAFGTYWVSRVYRLNALTSQIEGFTDIPNPDVLTPMDIRSVVSMAPNGTQFAATGLRGLFNRTWFHSLNRVVGTKNADLKRDFAVFPNPTTGDFTVKIPETDAPLSLTLTNLLGQIIWSKTLNRSDSAEQRRFSVAEKGVYLLQLQSPTGIAVQKLTVE